MKNTELSFPKMCRILGKGVRAFAMTLILVVLGAASINAQSIASVQDVSNQETLDQSNLINEQDAVPVLKARINAIKTAAVAEMDANGRTLANKDVKTLALFKIEVVRDIVISISEGLSLDQAIQEDFVNRFGDDPKMSILFDEIMADLQQ